MKILLIKPPLNRNLLSPTRGEPLELEYLASSVKEHKVEILDMRIDENLQKKLETFKPDLVGITAYTCDVQMAREVLKEIKKTKRNIRTAIGGHHVTFMPHDFALPLVDVIFLGISDSSFREYIDNMEKGGDAQSVKNIVLVKDNELHFTEQKQAEPDLNLLPLPARHLTLHYRKNYLDAMRNKIALVLASRGCPFRCTFCACWKIMNGKYITRNPESIVEEIAGLPDDIDLVCFADDNTLHHLGRAWRLSELIKERKIKKKFTMYARADTIVNHPELIESLRDGGLEYLTVGIESFNDTELDGLNKKSSVQTNNEAIRILQKLEVGISAHFMVNPSYTPEDFKRLFEYVCERKLFRPVFAVLTPLPGTELYLKNYDRLAIKDYDFFDFSHSIFHTKLSRKEFYRHYADLYKKAYSFQRYFKSKLKDFRSVLGKSKGSIKYNVDRISLLQMVLLHIYGYPLYLRIKNSYKSEPLILPPNS
jgi:radical SAM superfamily enzyme YgiQ (UPF0313 family)